MKVKLEMLLDVKDDAKALEELKKLETHAEHLLYLDGCPEIESVHDVKVTPVATARDRGPGDDWTLEARVLVNILMREDEDDAAATARLQGLLNSELCNLADHHIEASVEETLVWRSGRH